MASSFDRLKELNLSQDEVHRIGEALKNQEFRKLLADYVEEIQDPKNRQIYEDEVRQIERERGQEVTFLHPTPGYVIKTSINGNQKGFINICTNQNVNKPSSSPSIKAGVRGLQWSLPHSLSPPHEDIDNKGVRCQVFDVLFNPDTLHLASKNTAFRTMVNNTALEAVENNFNLNLDKANLRFPKMSYKGVPRASIMRKQSKNKLEEHTPEEDEIYSKIYSEIDAQRTSNTAKSSPKKSRQSKSNSTENTPAYTIPKYIIKHRSHVDIQDFTEHKDSKLNVTVPKELIVEINLPLLKSSSDMNLDVTEKTVQLISEKPAKYKLNLTLPYQVNEVNGTAKFDKDLKKLVITLPVKQRCVFDIARDDSGVESDPNSPTSTESSPESDAEICEKELVCETKCSDKIVDLKVANKQFEPRTKIGDDFLDDRELYTLPEFTCNVFENVLAFTLNVKNVDENTVFHNCNVEDSLFKVKFTSVSSSFYPSCYAFYVKFPNHKFIEDGVTIEVWDNNVILQIPLMASEKQFLSYFSGTNKESLTEKFLEEPAVINQLLNNCSDSSTRKKHSNNEQETENEEKNGEELIEDKMQEDKDVEEKKFTKSQSEAIDILATSYESSGDELSSSSFSPRKSKGILKRMSEIRSKFGRSVSESSLDDFVCSSFENVGSFEPGIPEDEEMSSSLKKTVRFNDDVKRQFFRSNSSILGQKKKNQRKSRNKKRTIDRRHSESEASDVEIKREGDIKTCEETEIEKVFNEVGFDKSDKKDDIDIFHLEINN